MLISQKWISLAVKTMGQSGAKINTLTIGLVGKVEYASFREDDELTPAAARKRDTDELWLTLVYNFE